MLESVERGTQVGRYSFLGAGCDVVSLAPAPDADAFAPLRTPIYRLRLRSHPLERDARLASSQTAR